MSKIYKAKRDIVFKILFGSNENKDILADFLQAILGYPKEEFEKIDILNPFLDVKDVDNKQGILDIKLTTKSGTVLDIEIQVKKMESMRKRIIFYTSKLFADQLKQGEDYSKLKKTISILICTDHNLIPEAEEYHNTFYLQTKKQVVLDEIFEIDILELQKVPEEDRGKLATWLRFLDTNDKEELDMIAKKGVGFNKAVDRLIRISSDEKTKMLIEARDKALHDEATLVSEAERKGEKNKSVEIAKSLINAGMSIDFVSKHTGLSKGEIEVLKC